MHCTAHICTELQFTALYCTVLHCPALGSGPSRGHSCGISSLNMTFLTATPSSPAQTLQYILLVHCLARFYTVFVLLQDKGYTVKHTPSAEGFPEGTELRQRGTFHRISRVES